MLRPCAWQFVSARICAHKPVVMFRTAVLETLGIKMQSLEREAKPAERGEAIITAAQMRASRALLGIDQRTLADMAGLSLPTIQRMEASEGVIRGNVDSQHVP